ncbi:MAG: hypothetical protein ACOC6S_02080 [Chloroflexota bacterium]
MLDYRLTLRETTVDEILNQISIHPVALNATKQFLRRLSEDSPYLHVYLAIALAAMFAAGYVAEEYEDNVPEM